MVAGAMGTGTRTRPVPGWLLVAGALLALGAASLMAHACERGVDRVGAQPMPPCTPHDAPAGCCAHGGPCVTPEAPHRAALLPASGEPPGPEVAPVPDLVAAWPTFVVPAPPSAVVLAAGPPPALEGVVLLN